MHSGEKLVLSHTKGKREGGKEKSSLGSESKGCELHLKKISQFQVRKHPVYEIWQGRVTPYL